MSQTIKDDEFDNIRLDDQQRVVPDREFASIGAVGGAGAVKSIFNKQNKGRLIVIGIAVGVLFGAVIYFGFVSEPPKGGGIAGTTNQATRVVGTSSVNQQATTFETNAAADYNENVLPEVQKQNPAAHPILVTDAEEPRPKENPFKPASELKNPGKLSETGGTQTVAPNTANAGQQSQGQGQQANYQQMDVILNQLIESEAKPPMKMAVSWEYAEGGADGEDTLEGIPSEGSADASATQCDRIERAGQMAMATADFAINSDVGGPVSLTVRSGKLRGAQLIGKFERKEIYLRMELDKLVTPEETLPVDAIGLDMETTLNAVEGDLDRHILYRYGWWGVGTVLKAIGKAAENNANEQVIVADGAVVTTSQQDSARELKMAFGSLGSDIGDAMQDRLNRPITVSMKVGDQVGIYFLEDVCAARAVN